jgi:enamine deaminase RidA (YjgF/YER057c/UK114 family)
MADGKRQNHMADGVHAVVRGGDRPAFPHAVSVAGARTIYVSGQLAMDKDGNLVGPGDMKAQFVQVGENIKAVLAQAGAGLEDIVKMNTYVTDLGAFFTCMDVRGEYFGPGWPTSTSVEVSKLAHPEAMIEIEVVALAD